MEPKHHEGEALWSLLDRFKVNKRKLSAHLKKTDSILNKWKENVFLDTENLQKIRGYFLYHYGFDIREVFPRLPEEIPDVASVNSENTIIYGDPEKVLFLKNREIEQLETKNLELTNKLNEIYDKIFSGYFEKIVDQFDTQNKLMKAILDARVKQ